MSGENIAFGQAEGALKQIAERVEQARAKFEQDAKKLDGQIQSLKGKGWQGEGGTSLQFLNTAWQEKHHGVTTALNKFHASLTESEKDNIATDQAAGTQMNNLYNKLGEIAN